MPVNITISPPAGITLSISAAANIILNTGSATIIYDIQAAVSDETSALAAGTGEMTFRLDRAITLASVRASVGTAPTGSAIQVDINKNGSTILSTKITIDAGVKTSKQSGTQPVLNTTVLADNDEITVDIIQVGSTVAGAGLKIYLIGTNP
jgi:hypothetical protein